MAQGILLDSKILFKIKTLKKSYILPFRVIVIGSLQILDDPLFKEVSNVIQATMMTAKGW